MNRRTISYGCPRGIGLASLPRAPSPAKSLRTSLLEPGPRSWDQTNKDGTRFHVGANRKVKHL